MIIKAQALVFILFGMVAWHGVDNAIEAARRDTFASVIQQMTLAQLTDYNIGG